MWWWWFRIYVYIHIHIYIRHRLKDKSVIEAKGNFFQSMWAVSLRCVQPLFYFSDYSGLGGRAGGGAGFNGSGPQAGVL